MEFLRVGETLLRSSQPLMSFLVPSASRTSLSSFPRRKPRQISRLLSTTSTCLQQSAATKESPTTSTATDEFSRLLDSTLSGTKGVPTAPTGRTSRFASPRAQETSTVSRQVNEASKSSRSSIDELLSVLKDPSPARQPTSPPNQKMDVGNLLSSALDPQNLVAKKSQPPAATPQLPPMKLSPSTGRTVYVEAARGMDVGRAFRTLEVQCARNSVRKDFQMQRFHERPGLKRKRLKSERWRKRFKEEFKRTVQMVQRLKGQGW